MGLCPLERVQIRLVRERWPAAARRTVRCADLLKNSLGADLDTGFALPLEVVLDIFSRQQMKGESFLSLEDM